MSTENITKFNEVLASDPDLQAKLRDIQQDVARDTAEKIAALSAEAGTPFSADEFLRGAVQGTGELSEEQLESVSGGWWNSSEANVMTSIITLGIGCAFIASASALFKGDKADDCQPSKWGK